MKSSMALVVAFAALAAALAAATPGAAQFDEQDREAVKKLSDQLAKATGSGNLKPGFTTLFLARKNAKGVYAAPAAQAVIQYDGRLSLTRTVAYDAPTGQADHADYGLYFDGWPGTLGWTGSDRFLAVQGSRFTLDSNGAKHSLYVADIVDVYPGLGWLDGPFSIIREVGRDEIYAVWSSRLNWPVFTPDWQVEGGVIDGKLLGLDGAALDKAVQDKEWPTRLERLAAARKAFVSSLAIKPIYQGKPVDVLPAYRAPPSSQDRPAINDPEAKIAETYIPQAATAGGATTVAALNVRITTPAFWTVSRGNRRVFILGVPWLFKSGVEWNQSRLANRLRDQQGKLLLPPLLANEAPPDAVETRQDEADKIPDDYRARIQKAAAAIGQPADRYLRLSPLRAGYRLTTDFRAKYGLEAELATVQVSQAALHMNFYPYNVGTVHWPNSATTVPAPEAGLACLDAALGEVESGPSAFDKAMAGWANGDVRAALSAPRGLEQCSFAFPIESEIRRDGINLQVDAVRQALSPGNPRIVLVVYLRALLSEDGVLAQLQAQGFKIDNPSLN